MIINVQLKDEYRIDSPEKMESVNNIFIEKNVPVSWNYYPQTNIINLNLSDDFDTEFLKQYGEIITDNGEV
jgi:hypothetical protein